jgi:hypothetical protein
MRTQVSDINHVDLRLRRALSFVVMACCLSWSRKFSIAAADAAEAAQTRHATCAPAHRLLASRNPTRRPLPGDTLDT